MNQQHEFTAIARAIIDTNLYMVLGTADESGRPWVTPVYYASADYKAFYWVSSLEAQHSCNIETRPQISIVVFNSQVQISTGQAVYMSAVVETLTGIELDRGLDIYSRSALARGGREWKKQDALPPAAYRLYRATASEQWILDPTASPDRRVLVTL
jgi:nitroimidazol reductase NimA-like FMN-containing flavoprotein (pyridoxamine 5'-phosphate oxidase superfamily)